MSGNEQACPYHTGIDEETAESQREETAVCPLPVADGKTGLLALKELIRQRSLLAPLELMHARVGDAFQITLPGFQPAVVVGPEANRQVMVDDRDKFLWRTDSDPVTRLLRHGVLVEDGDRHDELRAHMDPLLARRRVAQHVDAMWEYTAQVSGRWQDGQTVDMLVEMRRVALLILMGTLFKVDIAPDLDRLWPTILHVLEYISPGLWIVWPNLPRPQYKQALAEMDEYLFGIIRQRRRTLETESDTFEADDMLSQLIQTPDMTDNLIRDQLLTLLIAGHDTSTALMAWIFYLLGRHPDTLQRAQTEVDSVLAGRRPTYDEIQSFTYIDQVVKETLRLYPPIHVGNRRAAEDLEIGGYRVPADTRVMVSIYLAHRDPKQWPEPEAFKPERFDRNHRRDQPPLTYVPFGAGPRNCIGAAFAQVEARVILAQILQSLDLALLDQEVRPYMGATLEPRPGVMMQARRRER